MNAHEAAHEVFDEIERIVQQSDNPHHKAQTVKIFDGAGFTFEQVEALTVLYREAVRQSTMAGLLVVFQVLHQLDEDVCLMDVCLEIGKIMMGIGCGPFEPPSPN